MRTRFCATMRRPAFSMIALIAPVRWRSVASGLRIENVRSIAIVEHPSEKSIGAVTERNWSGWIAAAYTQRAGTREDVRDRQEHGMKSRYQKFAGYNRWCNERLYEAAAKMPEADYRADRGAFFRSLHGTLNHLLVGDRIWMRRFTGVGDVPPSLDAILHNDFTALRDARRSEDVKIVRYVGNLSDADLM